MNNTRAHGLPLPTVTSGAASWLLESLSWLFGPFPGSRAHVDLYFETVRLRHEELRKPEGERNEPRLLHLTKKMLRLESERTQVSRGCGCFSREGRC